VDRAFGTFVELRAILTLSDLEAALRLLTPLRILVDPELNRYVELAEPTEVSLVAGEGMKLRTSGVVQWSLAGVPVRAVVLGVDALLMPSVEATDSGAALRFGLRLSKLDVQYTPGLVEETILTQVNATLAEDRHALCWNFSQTLAASFALPRVLPSTTLWFATSAATVEIDATAVAITIPLQLKVSRDSTAQTESTP
jgi:hypothetical protein